MTTKSRLGLIGPIIVIVGVAVAGLGVWYTIHARPTAGDVIDTFAVGNGDTIVLRAEAGGDRAFVELRHKDDAVAWQGLIPHYAGAKGRPAVAWSPTAVSVRIDRDGRAEIFALAMESGAKLGGFRLAPDHEPVTTQTQGPITLTDHQRSYELVSGADWHRIVAVDLRTGEPLWTADLGPGPITDGGTTKGDVWVLQDGHKRSFAVFTGHEETSSI